MSVGGNSFFQHNMIRRYTIAFGDLFNDIKVERYDNDGNHQQTIPVPLAYGPKEKWLVRQKQDPDLDRPTAIQLPRMSFEIVSMQYDSQRKLATTQKNRAYDKNDPNKLLSQYAPVPYDINFQLNIMVKNANDGVAIVEQILPFFTPEWNITVNTIPDMGISRDVPLVLNDVTNEDIYEQNFEERRSLIWTLDFTMKAYIYGPIRKSGLIKKTIINFYAVTDGDSVDITDDAIANTAVSSRVTTIPGVTSDGEPTSNTELAIDYREVEETDDYGFASNVEFFTSGTE